MTAEAKFEETYEQFKHTAQEVFLRDGTHLTIAVICDAAGEASLIPLTWSDVEEKERVFSWLAEEFEQQAQWYVYVAEAWQIATPPLDDLIGQKSPSTNERRVEVLHIAAGHRDGRRRSISWLIKRDPLALELQGDEGGQSNPNMEAVLFGREWTGVVIDKADSTFRLQ